MFPKRRILVARERKRPESVDPVACYIPAHDPIVYRHHLAGNGGYVSQLVSNSIAPIHRAIVTHLLRTPTCPTCTDRIRGKIDKSLVIGIQKSPMFTHRDAMIWHGRVIQSPADYATMRQRL